MPFKIQSNTRLFLNRFSMSEIPERVADKLPVFQDHSARIQKEGDSLESSLREEAIFQDVNTKNQLGMALSQVEGSMLLLAKICLSKMRYSSNQIGRLEMDLDHVEGSLNATRANAGRQTVPSPPPAPSIKKIDDQFLPVSRKANVDFMGSAVEMNMHTLDQVGRRMEDETQEVKTLIYKVDPGNPKPEFWSRTNDYFIPLGNRYTEMFSTSFSEFYGFEAVPDLTEEIAQGSLYRYLEEEQGMVIVTSKRTITVEPVTGADRKWLDLGEYNCVAVVSNQVYNSQGVMFEYTQSRHVPSIFRFQDNAVRRGGARNSLV